MDVAYVRRVRMVREIAGDALRAGARKVVRVRVLAD